MAYYFANLVQSDRPLLHSIQKTKRAMARSVRGTPTVRATPCDPPSEALGERGEGLGDGDEGGEDVVGDEGGGGVVGDGDEGGGDVVRDGDEGGRGVVGDGDGTVGGAGGDADGDGTVGGAGGDEDGESVGEGAWIVRVTTRRKEERNNM